MKKELQNFTMEELYDELLSRMGYNHNENGCYQKVENGKLNTYKDTSYHGSCHFELYSSKELSHEELNILNSLIDINKYIKKVSNKKEFEKIEEEIKFLRLKQKNLIL